MKLNVFYVSDDSKLIPERFGGIVYGFIIFIRNKYKNDLGLLAHEKVHVRQFFRVFLLHVFLYKFWRRYRLRSEVEGYREQIKHYDDNSSFNTYYKVRFATFLSEKYNLNITVSQAFRYLWG